MRQLVALTLLFLPLTGCSSTELQPFANVPQKSVITIAGNAKVGTQGGGFSAATTTALEAQFKQPCGMAVYQDRYVYFCDQPNNCVRKIDLHTSQASIVAGTGKAGFSGDGGLATNAQLDAPEYLALDAQGNLYIADLINYRIRRVDTDGVISTVIGTGENDPAIVGANAVNSPVYEPKGVAVDRAGNVYISETDYCRIVRINASTGMVEAVAGGGDKLGDGGPATKASLVQPYGLCFDDEDNLYIADASNNRIRVVDADTGTIETVVGNGNETSGDGGLAIEAGTSHPWDVDYSNGCLYVMDGSSYVRKVDMSTGIISRLVGSGENGHSDEPQPALDCMLFLPTTIAVDRTGNVYIADNWNHRIKVAIKP